MGDFTYRKREVDKVVTRSGENMTKLSIFTLRNKCIYLSKAYKTALKNWGDPVGSSGWAHVAKSTPGVSMYLDLTQQ